MGILTDDGRMKPFCNACQSIPTHGYCRRDGCPMRPVSREGTGDPCALHKAEGIFNDPCCPACPNPESAHDQ